MMENSTNLNECAGLTITGFYCLTLFLLSTVSNMIVLTVFVQNKKIINHVNILNIFLSILNLFGTITALPMVAISAFKCQ